MENVKFKKGRLLFLSSLLCCGLYGDVLVDGISFLVDGEAVTLFEAYTFMQNNKLSKDEAIEALISDKLMDSQIKLNKIKVSHEEVEEEAKNIAKSNNLTLFEFKNVLLSKNISWDTYLRDLKQNMLRSSLHKAIINDKIKAPSDSELAEFYDKNKGDFEMAKEVDVIKFFSNDRKLLESILLNPTSNLVTREEESISLDKVNQNLAMLLNKTPKNSFTTIIQVGGGFILFFVKEKKGISYIPLSEIRDLLLSKYFQKLEAKLLKEYKEKLRADAKVTILRMPN